ncbi:hypothetical protein M0813_23007 [Anaeramoeba flamelloides]|uniref:Band 7 domain-containing protein n=1 Tax=Anaeramoeba flamelloides TaxID=1746091 RepID=A0ABQ8YBR9_9EUKA|nr:hypothetical protein M0813_23007 [Anaeramoeba flamelloides]
MADDSNVGGYVGFFIAFALVLIILYTLFFKLIRIVRRTEVMIIERYGKYHRTLTPGINLLAPFIDSPRVVNWRYAEVVGNRQVVRKMITDRIDLREHVIDCTKQRVISRDLVEIEIDAILYFQILDPKQAVFSIQNLPDALELLTQASTRNIIAQLTLDDTFSSRELINRQLKQQIESDCNRWGVVVHRCEIFNINPPGDIKQAMEIQITEERERRATVLIADGRRESMIVRSRGSAAKIVLDAEGRKVSQLQQAKGNAEAKKLLAKAEARSITAIREAINVVGVKATDYLLTIQYLRSLINSFNSKKGSLCVLIPQTILDNISKIGIKN